MIVSTAPVSSSDPVVAQLMADIVRTPFNKPLFNPQNEISTLFAETLQTNPLKVRETFLTLRGKIVEQLHCRDLEKIVKDEEAKDPLQKIMRLAHVVDRINDFFRRELLTDFSRERHENPFEELETYINFFREKGIEIGSFRLQPQ